MLPRKLFLPLGLLIISLGAAPLPPDPIPYLKDGKLGYANAARHLVIPAVYDEASRFTDGRALVSQGGRKGFIDAAGKVVIPLSYLYAEPFSDGLAAVGLDGAPTGVSVGVGANRRVVTGRRYGFIDRDGKVVVAIEYDWVLPFRNGAGKVVNGISPQDRWGLVDPRGRFIVPPRYRFVHYPSEGLAPVYEEHTAIQTFAFVDLEGHEVIPTGKYTRGGEEWREGRFLVVFKGKAGFIDKTGKEVIPTQYEEASYFSEGRSRVKLNGKYGFIDAAGKLVIPATYDEASEFSSGLAAVRVGVKWAFVDKDGKPVGPTRFDWRTESICGDWNAHEGLRKIVVGGKYGFMDDKGAIVISPQFQCAMGFAEGLAPVKQRDLWGFIDRTGTLVIPYKYFRVDLGFDRGFANVTLKLPGNGGWHTGFIDRQGNEFFEGRGVY